jgi:hypothetical protein
VLTLITALFSFGGWLYQSGHHGFGLILLSLGSFIAAIVILLILFTLTRMSWRFLRQFRITRIGDAPRLAVADQGIGVDSASVDRHEALVKERDALAMAFERAEQQISARNEIIQQKDEVIRQRADFIDKLAPKVRWADSLIARERGAATQFMRVGFFLARERYLAAAEAEPYFDIDVLIDYRGALRLVVEIVQLGNLSWNNRLFAVTPKVTHSQSQELPFDAEGPTACNLTIRQHVSKDKAAEIKSQLATSGNELLLITKGLRISASLKDYAGETVAVLESVLGDWLEIKPRT